MARRSQPVSIPSPDEGYPVPRTVDGVDTSRIANLEGYNRNLGRCLNQHTDWKNSKTGADTEPPEYAKNEDYY